MGVASCAGGREAAAAAGVEQLHVRGVEHQLEPGAGLRAAGRVEPGHDGLRVAVRREVLRPGILREPFQIGRVDVGTGSSWSLPGVSTC